MTRARNTSGEQRNEGEGNRTAARQYNDATTRFARSGKVDRAARKAEKALDSAEGSELKRAEDVGKQKAGDVEKCRPGTIPR